MVARQLVSLIESRDANVGILGLGYVGLPLAMAAFDAGFRVTGFDIDARRVSELAAGKSPISRIPNEKLKHAATSGRIKYSANSSDLASCDALIICVPTPLDKHREPDLSYIVKTSEMIATVVRKGQIVSLESTTYPGTTTEVMKPILEKSGLVAGEDFFLCFSPEREDPGNPDFHTSSIPKVVGGDGPDASLLGQLLYGAIVDKVVPVASCEVAEAVKLTENIFRSVNIALVNELKVIYGRMGINIWEVIEAAKTKPFGYMPFYPGPGLGGHCIPIDPFYLTWKAREYDVPTRFIELAGEINTRAPYLVVDILADALGRRVGKALARSKVLMIGIAYKKNVEDTRESPAFKLIELIESAGGQVSFHDPYVPVVPQLREHPEMSGRAGVALTPEHITDHDAVLICTDHDNVDYALIAAHAKLIIDTRNAMRGVKDRSNIVLA